MRSSSTSTECLMALLDICCPNWVWMTRESAFILIKTSSAFLYLMFFTEFNIDWMYAEINLFRYSFHASLWLSVFNNSVVLSYSFMHLKMILSRFSHRKSVSKEGINSSNTKDEILTMHFLMIDSNFFCTALWSNTVSTSSKVAMLEETSLSIKF